MIVSLAEFKTYIKQTSTNLDSQLTQALEFAQAWAERYCNQEFDVNTRSILLTCPQYGYNLLKNSNISAINTVKFRDRPVSDYTTLDSDFYKLVEVSNFPYVWLDVYYLGYEYEINYDFGWTDSNSPQLLRSTICEMAAVIYRESGNKEDITVGMSSTAMNANGMSITKAYNVLDIQKKRWHMNLEKYRIVAS